MSSHHHSFRGSSSPSAVPPVPDHDTPADPSITTATATQVVPSHGDLFDPSAATSIQIHGALTSTSLSTTTPSDPSSSSWSSRINRQRTASIDPPSKRRKQTDSTNSSSTIEATEVLPSDVWWFKFGCCGGSQQVWQEKKV
ncbi:hypothetical protein SAY86_027062 [Trapa natans]|uniref:Uncharacterized protein n=1 Tax=Trapa natans TaxID=22666 RepID=A0AAN7KLV4_TRANT|nr:hypothetical protein SAY86_027062 [Trapa natans]